MSDGVYGFSQGADSFAGLHLEDIQISSGRIHGTAGKRFRFVLAVGPEATGAGPALSVFVHGVIAPPLHVQLRFAAASAKVFLLAWGIRRYSLRTPQTVYPSELAARAGLMAMLIELGFSHAASFELSQLLARASVDVTVDRAVGGMS